MNNTKSLINKDRIKFTWIVLWLLLIIATTVIYINHPFTLASGDDVSFWAWIIALLAPHNWLGLATILLTIKGSISIWKMCEQKWPLIKDYRFVPISMAIAILLVLIGIYF